MDPKEARCPEMPKNHRHAVSLRVYLRKTLKGGWKKVDTLSGNYVLMMAAHKEALEMLKRLYKAETDRIVRLDAYRNRAVTDKKLKKLVKDLAKCAMSRASCDKFETYYRHNPKLHRMHLGEVLTTLRSALGRGKDLLNLMEHRNRQKMEGQWMLQEDNDKREEEGEKEPTDGRLFIESIDHWTVNELSRLIEKEQESQVVEEESEEVVEEE
mmetsp:Transcript_20289/g.51913  ORF Transcript_20289/g.51913 Transcript_20289/m.51913 type:complete len:212 (+) Transcript_20289:2717-3352(+)